MAKTVVDISRDRLEAATEVRPVGGDLPVRLFDQFDHLKLRVGRLQHLGFVCLAVVGTCFLGEVVTHDNPDIAQSTADIAALTSATQHPAVLDTSGSRQLPSDEASRALPSSSDTETIIPGANAPASLMPRESRFLGWRPKHPRGEYSQISKRHIGAGNGDLDQTTYLTYRG
ncbi:MAG: hypothetical protein F8N36_14350 [Desulfovibrio sp.]|uniref:hypothetical protein n=1 Tax=Desulfovibrio sp. TaxID=885 RepID=UPI00135D4DC1|nr:hypothetical protein [Desulfovibrio sp.]MTJ94019.1 hypothetical protein [Desulfovibrio sp.]